MTRTNFGSGQGLRGWTQPTLGSKPSLVGITTPSTRRAIIFFADERHHLVLKVAIPSPEHHENTFAKSAYLAVTFVGVFLAIKPAI